MKNWAALIDEMLAAQSRAAEHDTDSKNDSIWHQREINRVQEIRQEILDALIKQEQDA